MRPQTEAGISIFDLNNRETHMTTNSLVPLGGFQASREVREVTKEYGDIPEEIVCPYDDSREGRYMNKTGLAEMGRHWQEVFDDLSWCNTLIFVKKPKVITLDQARLVTGIALALPSYLTLRAEERFDEIADLPDNVGRLYRTAAGVNKALEDMRRRSWQYKSETIITPEEVYDYANIRGLLTKSQDDTYSEACAAPPEQLIKALNALFYRESAEPFPNDISQYIPDPNAFIRYSEIYITTQVLLNDLSTAERIYEVRTERGKKESKAHEARTTMIVIKRKETAAELTALQNEVNELLGLDPVEVPGVMSTDLIIKRLERKLGFNLF